VEATPVPRSARRDPAAGGSPPGGEPSTGASWRRLEGALPFVALVLILGASLLPRLPLLFNADALWSSDEAVNALTVRHLVKDGELRLHPWDVSYYGLTEGLLAMPFLACRGFTAAAFKLAAVTGFLALLAAVFVLGRRLAGGAVALTAAAILALFSPQLVRWSTMAASGFTLIIAWGTLTLALHDRPRRRAVGWRHDLILFACGLFAGLGLYTYELYLVYLVTLAAAWLLAAGFWLALLARRPAARREAVQAAPRRLREGSMLAAGFAVGWAPNLALLLRHAPRGGNQPGYGLAGASQVAHNLRLLGSCLMALFGVNPGADRSLLDDVGPTGEAAAALGAVLLIVYGIAWLAAARRIRRDLAAAVEQPRRALGVEVLLVLLVPVTLLLFTFSTNPQNLGSNRYLLPLLTSLPLLAAAWLMRLARRSKPAAAVLAAVLIGLPAAQIYAWEVRAGLLDPGLRPLRKHETLYDVLGYLAAQGVRGAYAEYWTSYKATFLAGERIVVAPLLTWDRYPALGREVDALPTEAYIFHSRFASARHGEAQLVEALRAGGRPFALRSFREYRVYTSLDHRRLLPPPCRPRPIAAPTALLEATPPPAAVSPGGQLEMPVRIANRGTGTWPAAGLGFPFAIGQYRVQLDYRWLEAAGRSVPGTAAAAAAATTEAEGALLPRDLPAGAAISLVARVLAPRQPGSYQLALFVTQAGFPWAERAGGGLVFPLEVKRP
jgi:hypothetical protein